MNDGNGSAACDTCDIRNDCSNIKMIVRLLGSELKISGSRTSLESFNLMKNEIQEHGDEFPFGPFDCHMAKDGLFVKTLLSRLWTLFYEIEKLNAFSRSAQAACPSRQVVLAG